MTPQTARTPPSLGSCPETCDSSSEESCYATRSRKLGCPAVPASLLAHDYWCSQRQRERILGTCVSWRTSSVVVKGCIRDSDDMATLFGQWIRVQLWMCWAIQLPGPRRARARDVCEDFTPWSSHVGRAAASGPVGWEFQSQQSRQCWSDSGHIHGGERVIVPPLV